MLKMGSLDQLNQWSYTNAEFTDFLSKSDEISGTENDDELNHLLGDLHETDPSTWDEEMMMNDFDTGVENDFSDYLGTNLSILEHTPEPSFPLDSPVMTSSPELVKNDNIPIAPTTQLSAADKMRVFKQLQEEQQLALKKSQQQTLQQQILQLQQPQLSPQPPIIVSQQTQLQTQQPLGTSGGAQIIKLEGGSADQKQVYLLTQLFGNQGVTTTASQPQVVIQQAASTATNITTTTQGNLVSSLSKIPASSVMNKLPISPTPSIDLPQLPKGEKRVAHNAIEKRYRRSINDRIKALQQMVVGTDAKIQKSGVLQKAIDHINYLRKLSSRLKLENKELKARIEQMKGAASILIKAEPPTPPSSDTHSPRPISPGRSDYEPISPRSDSSESGDIIGMSDRSRFTLCIFMFAVLLFNPFGFLLGKATQNLASPDSPYGFDSGRTLKSVAAGDEDQSPLWSLAMSSTVWLVNVVLILGVIIQILIKGEPVTKPKSEASAEYWKHRHAAEEDVTKNEHAAALSHIQLALKALGRAVPLSRFDMWACTIWNLLRFFLNKVFIGRWLAKRAGGFQKDDTEDGKYTTAETSARDAALMYLKYLQLALISSKPLSALSVTSLGLMTLNLAHCAGEALSCEHIAEVYATVALALKHTYTKKLRFLSRYFFSKGRTFAKEYNRPAHLDWMHNALAYSLAKQEEIPITPRRSLFAQIAEPSNPLSCLTQGLHEKMLETALYQLIVPMENNGKKGVSEPKDALHILSYLENPDSNGRPPQDNLSFVDCRDVCKWWSQIVVVAAHWMLGEDEAAERRYYSIEKLPAVLEFSDTTLPKAVLLAFRARKILMSGEVGRRDECMFLCNKAGICLQKSVSYTGPLRHERLHAGIHLLVADWLLATRTTLWQQLQQPNADRPQLATLQELSKFQQDLSALRRVAGTVPSVMPKVFFYQAMSRFMAGANPAQTQQLLDRSLRQKISSGSSMFSKEIPEVVVSKRDRAQALVAACRHLPTFILSSSEQRERMLNEAAQCFEQAGDRWGLRDCQQLLANIKKDCSEAGEEISRQAAILTG